MEKKATVKKTKVLSVGEFNALPKAEQRVMIAKDVIKQVKAKKYLAKRMTYVDMKIPQGVDKSEDARKHIDQIEECQVCALGACLLSTTRYKNTLTIEQIYNPIGSNTKRDTGAFLQTVFPIEQLAAIESAFERGYSQYNYWSTGYTKDGDMGGRLDDDMADKVEKFGNKYDNSEDRLIGIMENIVKNKGTFKP